MSFEEQSFRNLIHFFKKELTQINRGKSPSEVFNAHLRIRLSKKKVWLKDKNRNKVSLTERTLKVLEGEE